MHPDELDTGGRAGELKQKNRGNGMGVSHTIQHQFKISININSININSININSINFNIYLSPSTWGRPCTAAAQSTKPVYRIKGGETGLGVYTDDGNNMNKISQERETEIPGSNW